MSSSSISTNELLPLKTVKGNDWRVLNPVEIGEETPTKTVTVILPCYMGQSELELTFAGLSIQTYPSHLIEVIVVDDGSDPPIDLPTGVEFSASVIAQKRDGFGLARARNLGAKRANGEILVFLDCDMIPEPQLVEAHARWHHVNDRLLTLGFRHHTDFDGVTAEVIRTAGGPAKTVSDRKVTSPRWINFHMTRTRNLTSTDDDLFRIATGGNLGVCREFFERVGGCDSSFRQWGGEDIEFGFRAFNWGGVLVPERKAIAWHQGEGAAPDPAEELSLVQQRHRLAHLIAEKTFRRSVAGRSFEVPLMTVSLEVLDETFDEVAEQIDAVLASDFHDLVVGVSVPTSHPDQVRLEREYGNDPRVLIVDDLLAAVPHAAFRLEVPSRVILHPLDIGILFRGLEDRGLVRVDLGRTGELRMARTRALRRAEHAGVDDVWTMAGFLFGERVMDSETIGATAVVGRLSISSGPSLNPTLWYLTIKVLRKVLKIRSFRDAVTLSFWLVRGTGNVLRRARRATSRKRSDRLHRRSLRSVYLTPDWLRIVGDREHLPGSRLWDGKLSGVEVVVVAPSADKDDFISPSGVSLVRLGEESGIPCVPPINHRRFNPAGFRHVSGGAIDSIPDSVWPEDRIRLGRSALGIWFDSANDIDSATCLVEFAASGIPVILKNPNGAAGWIGTALTDVVTGIDTEKLSDPTERERISVVQRRVALKKHSFPERLKQIRLNAELAVLSSPSVSVVVATNRPQMVERIIRMVSVQDYPNKELVLALHGDEFGDINPVVPNELPLTVLHFPSKSLFGDVLSKASIAASGEWQTKMDDDDWYGSEHISDLLLAANYSDAELIGKGSEFVYLEDEDLTIRRDLGDSETESRTLAGGTLMIRTEMLRATSGWRSLSQGVDVALIDDVIASGGKIWRTHPFGYLLRRTSGQHTWKVGSRYFLRHAQQDWEGSAFKIVGVVGDL